ncbi:MAG: flagellar filament capping protein FliD [Polyangiaceae bacterium]
MSITISGLASGLDVNAIIDGLVKAESVPLTAISTKKTNLQAAASTISGIETKLATLRSAASALADPVQFASFKTSSSDSTVVPSVSGNPSAGSYDVQVTQLAQEQRTYSDAQSSSTDDLNQAGTLSLQVGTGTKYDVTVSATDSLTDIASAINKTGARVSASVLYDGKGGYRLQVRGLDTGGANAVTLTETGTTLGLDSATSPDNTYQKAQNAKLKVDNIDVERSTNQIVGVIPGVTFAVTKKTTSAATITVASDPSALATKIQSFVSAYNDVVKAGHTAAGWGDSAASNTVLAGDASIRTMLDKLSRVISTPATGASGKYATMMSVGLASARDGTISLDSSKLSDAIAQDPASVQKLFVVDAKNGLSGLMGNMKTTIDSLTSGKYASLQLRLDALNALATKCDDESTALQRRIDAYKTQLTNQFANLETIMTQTKTQTSALNGIKDVNSKSD